MTRPLEYKLPEDMFSMTIMHFLVAVKWVEGIQVAVEHGGIQQLEQLKRSVSELLNIAIKYRSISMVIILLQVLDDCFEKQLRMFGVKDFCSCLGKAIEMRETGICDELISFMVRRGTHRFESSIYHGVYGFYESPCKGFTMIYDAGFRNVDACDERGRTPLMRACLSSDFSAIDLLLCYGASPFARQVGTGRTAGHFLTKSRLVSDIVDTRRSKRRRDNDESLEVLRSIVCIGFQQATLVPAQCYCSPDGFSPLTSLIQSIELDEPHFRKRHVKGLLFYFGADEAMVIEQIRQFVLLEVFDRLGLYHTCDHWASTISARHKENQRRKQTQGPQLHNQLAQWMCEYDKALASYQGCLYKFIDQFLDRLDEGLRAPLEQEDLLPEPDTPDTDIISPGRDCQKHYFTSRGKRVGFEHKEPKGEDYLIEPLFRSEW